MYGTLRPYGSLRPYGTLGRPAAPAPPVDPLEAAVDPYRAVLIAAAPDAPRDVEEFDPHKAVLIR